MTEDFTEWIYLDPDYEDIWEMLHNKWLQHCKACQIAPLELPFVDYLLYQCDHMPFNHDLVYNVDKHWVVHQFSMSKEDSES